MKDRRASLQRVLPFQDNLKGEGCILLYTDGASRGNPGESGIGVVIKGSEGQIIEEISEYIGVATNNRAEYIALIEGLEAVIRLKGVHGSRLPGRQTGFTVHGLRILSDSELLVKQLNGQYKVKDSNLRGLYNKVFILLSEFESRTGSRIEIGHIPREYNKEADRLANKAIDIKVRRRTRSRPDDRSGDFHCGITGEESPSSTGQGAP